ncbi:hypothetical protein GWI33_014909, partial [Rhynchophorus ferrugineus]
CDTRPQLPNSAHDRREDEVERSEAVPRHSVTLGSPVDPDVMVAGGSRRPHASPTPVEEDVWPRRCQRSLQMETMGKHENTFRDLLTAFVFCFVSFVFFSPPC